ncbi:MAG: sulfite exporter TauE/SafE family protein [Rubrivivax sp.]
MQTALLATAAFLGLAGMPHCTAMCSAPCAAALGPGATPASTAAFHAARLLGYAFAGAVVASAVGGLASLSALAPALRPLWTLLHAAALMLGVCLLWQGRQPAWFGRVGRVPAAARKAAMAPGTAALATPLMGPWPGAHAVSARIAWRPLARASGAGGAWMLWPCGLLQSALLVAALAADATMGATVMAVFAATSAPGLLLGPWLGRRLFNRGRHPAARERLATRAAGALLVLASGWALGHGLWSQVAAYCGFA